MGARNGLFMANYLMFQLLASICGKVGASPTDIQSDVPIRRIGFPDTPDKLLMQRNKSA
jgi:hypothetical protein